MNHRWEIIRLLPPFIHIPYRTPSKGPFSKGFPNGAQQDAVHQHPHLGRTPMLSRKYTFQGPSFQPATLVYRKKKHDDAGSTGFCYRRLEPVEDWARLSWEKMPSIFSESSNLDRRFLVRKYINQRKNLRSYTRKFLNMTSFLPFFPSLNSQSWIM